MAKEKGERQIMQGMMMTPKLTLDTLELRKNNTRRLMTPQPSEDWVYWGLNHAGARFRKVEDEFETFQNNIRIKPRYKPNEIIYLKESHAVYSTLCDHDFNYSLCVTYRNYRQDEVSTTEWIKVTQDQFVKYSQDKYNFGVNYFRNKMYMPALFARYFLRIKEVRAAKLHEISYYDWCSDFMPNAIQKEKALASGTGHAYMMEQAQILWDSINAKRGWPWSKNPWMWVYVYELITREEAFKSVKDKV